MDPVTIVVVGAAVLVAVPTIGKYSIYGAVKLGSKIKRSLKERKEYRLRHNKKYQDKLKKTRELQRAIEQRRAMPFKNTKNGAVKNVNINEIASFDIEKDVILKGTVYIANPNGGELAQDTIYLFPPRVYGANNVSIGPKLDKNGHLYDDNSYLLRTKESTDIYKGYVPKREVMTGRRFDYVNDSINKSDDPLNKFINVVIKKDANGNYIPLDKNNKQEMNDFYKYIEMRKEQNVDQDMYLDGIISKAKLAKEKDDEANKPRYAKPTEEISPSEMRRVQKVRESRAKKEAQNIAYYDRIRNMKLMDDTMHAYGLDEHAAHLPGGGVGMGMPPGPMPPSSQGRPSRGGRKR